MAAMGVPAACLKVPAKKMEAFQLGYIVGQLAAYCEQVNTGAKLAAQIRVPGGHLQAALDYIVQEGCKFVTERSDDLATIWIYKYGFVEALIDQLKNTCASELGIWTAGKLFGYSDYEIGRFLEAQGLTQNAP